MKVFFTLATCLMIASYLGQTTSSIIPTSTSTTGTPSTGSPRICSPETPCGWFSTYGYRMERRPNDCVCPPDKSCIRTRLYSRDSVDTLEYMCRIKDESSGLFPTGW